MSEEREAELAVLREDLAAAESALERAVFMPGTSPEARLARLRRVERATWWVARCKVTLAAAEAEAEECAA